MCCSCNQFAEVCSLVLDNKESKPSVTSWYMRYKRHKGESVSVHKNWPYQRKDKLCLQRDQFNIPAQMVPWWVLICTPVPNSLQSVFCFLSLFFIPTTVHIQTYLFTSCLQGTLKLIPKTSSWLPAGWRLSKAMNCSV